MGGTVELLQTYLLNLTYVFIQPHLRDFIPVSFFRKSLFEAAIFTSNQNLVNIATRVFVQILR